VRARRLPVGWHAAAAAAAELHVEVSPSLRVLKAACGVGKDGVQLERDGRGMVCEGITVAAPPVSLQHPSATHTQAEGQQCVRLRTQKDIN